MSEDAILMQNTGSIRKSVPSLTGVRGIGALWVFLFHISTISGIILDRPNFFGASFFRNGFRGVDLFFVLSGFILMHVHGNEFTSLNNERVWSFLIIRFFRVYPLNTVILVGLVPFALFAPEFVAQSRFVANPHFAYKIHNFSLAGFFQSLFLVQTWTVAKLGEWNGVSWTLSAEVLGYIFFPFLAVWTMRLKRASTCVAIATLFLVLMILILIGGHHLKSNTNPSGTFGALRMVGCFTAGMNLQRAYFLLGSRVDKWAIPLTLGSLFFIIATLFIRYTPILDCLAFAALIFGLASQKGPVDWLLRRRIVLWLGKISFSFYMIHSILIAFFIWLVVPAELNSSFLLKALSLVGLTIACLVAGWALFHSVERPSQQLARSMASRVNKIRLANAF